MTKSSASEFTDYRTTTSQVEWASVLFRSIETIAFWIERRRQRRALAQLDQHLLDDIGLTREQVRGELVKPFWNR